MSTPNTPAAPAAPAAVIPPPQIPSQEFAPDQTLIDQNEGMEAYAKGTESNWNSEDGAPPAQQPPAIGEGEPTAPAPAPATPAAPAAPVVAAPVAPAPPASLPPEQMAQLEERLRQQIRDQLPQQQQAQTPAAPAAMTPEEAKKILDEIGFSQLTQEQIAGMNSDDPQVRLATMQGIQSGAISVAFKMADKLGQMRLQKSMQELRGELGNAIAPAARLAQVQQEERDRNEFHLAYPAFAEKDDKGNLKYEQAVSDAAYELKQDLSAGKYAGQNITREQAFKMVAARAVERIAKYGGQINPLTPGAAPVKTSPQAQQSTVQGSHNTESGVPTMNALAGSGRNKGSSSEAQPAGNDGMEIWNNGNAFTFN